MAETVALAPVYCANCGKVIGRQTPNGLKSGARFEWKCRHCKHWTPLTGQT